MPVGHDTYATRRHLLHLEKSGKTYFVTFCAFERRILPPIARDIVLRCCVHDHKVTYWLYCAVVMPDHVHMIFTPLDEWPLWKIMKRVKGVSAHMINTQRGRDGAIWEEESFDRILRNDEDVY